MLWERIESEIALEDVNLGVLGKHMVWVEYIIEELPDHFKRLKERSHDISIVDYTVNGESIDHMRGIDFFCPLRRKALEAIKAEHNYSDWSI